MSVNTRNAYGNIFISDEAIATVIEHTVRECYGVVALADRKHNQTKSLYKQTKGVKILTLDNKIYIDLFVVLKFGVSINAVGESIKKTVRYKVEEFTGMIVDSININVVGVES